jgi:lipoyl(octanoyl) transferase
MAPRPSLRVIGPASMAYDDALRLQLERRDACLESGGADNSLLLLEHPPVITVGRSGDRADVRASARHLARAGVQLVDTNRGGQVTVHGPGQLVAYPIVHLGHHGRDLHRYLRSLEGWLIDVCAHCGVAARRRPPHTGVWVGDRKIASIGIAVRRWVAYHGVALNVSTDLSLFSLVIPCGMPQVEMTSLARELGRSLPIDTVADAAIDLFAARFGMSVEREPDLESIRA